MATITKRTVDALKADKKDTFLWDDRLPGFGVRGRPSGAKHYFLKYRTATGRQRWLSLGQHGALTPDIARGLALQAKASIANGADPSGARQKQRGENTIADLADRYLKEHVSAHNKPSTAKEITRLVETLVKPGLGRLKIGELSRADVKAWHQGLRETPTMANRALAACSKMMALAVVDWELCAENPCIGLKRFPERKRDRYFDDADLAKLGSALLALEGEGTEAPGFALLVRLLATTGMRLGEVLALRWSDVDMPGRSIRLADAKAGARTVHLGAAAIVLLDAVTEREGFVVKARDGEGPLSRFVAEKAWAKLRTRAGLENARLHDLRHTTGTFAALAGANAFAVRDLLGHKTLAMTGKYVERAAGMVRATADTVSNRVAAAMDANQRPPAEVVPLAREGVGMSTKKLPRSMAEEAEGIDLRDIEIDADNGLSGLTNYALSTAMIRDHRGASPRLIAIAAVEAAQLAFADMARRRLIHPASVQAFEVVSDHLGRLQVELRDLEAGAAPGRITAARDKKSRRPDSSGVIERQARALVAVGWLQKLTDKPLNKRDALLKVARTLHVTVKQIENWMDTFRRVGAFRRKEAIQDLWIAVEIDGQWAGGYERDVESATVEEVLAWLCANDAAK